MNSVGPFTISLSYSFRNLILVIQAVVAFRHYYHHVYYYRHVNENPFEPFRHIISDHYIICHMWFPDLSSPLFSHTLQVLCN